MVRTFILLLTAAMLAALPGVAAAGSVGDISVEHAWSRATPPGASAGAVFMTLGVTGKTADRLVKVDSPAARAAELHTMSVDGGVMKMRPVAAIEVKPGSKTELKPGGLHVMLIGLVKPLVEGEAVSLTLTFEKAGRVDVKAMVRKAGAQANDAAKGHHH